ncbi:MAG: DUF2779 domain-containing protein, partial [Flavobacteriales bacterium]|nr:DUF2779 domain-containing protein [Flavobacteriales bacterium]
ADPKDGDIYKAPWEETQELLKRDNVIIYEPAFLFDNLFIRVDILVKNGNKIELIEVKAKSYNPNNKNTFVGKGEKLVSSWKPYLYDVAFQNHVMQKCYPQWDISNHLLLADKTKKATVDGLNQMFRAVEGSDKRTGVTLNFDKQSDLGEPVLCKANIDDVIKKIQNSDPNFSYSEDLSTYTFGDLINTLAKTYKNDTFFRFMPKGRTCNTCEYKSDPKNSNEKSGYEYCYKNLLNWDDKDFKRPLVTDIWSLNYRTSDRLFESGKFFMDQLVKEDIKVKPSAGIMSKSERQWIQVEKVQNNDDSIYVLKDELKAEMNKWIFPLHFIDFETSTVALPFTKGMHPYEQVAFQYSHHIMYEDGRIEHASEYLNSKPGEFPNFDFVRSLKKDLEKDNGTIIKFATHENTVLNQIHEQLQNSTEQDIEVLQNFIESITKSKDGSVKEWEGVRNMVDLNRVIIDYYYNPITKGSNSIKAILPAVLQTSELLKGKYSQSIGELGVSSINFDITHTWLKMKDNVVQDPYKTLPSVFNNIDKDVVTISEITDVHDGGQALTAYGKLQYTNMTEEEREAISKSLLKYCELDTMAMVMIYEHLKEVVE